MTKDEARRADVGVGDVATTVYRGSAKRFFAVEGDDNGLLAKCVRGRPDVVVQCGFSFLPRALHWATTTN
jgi:hypothetical protein